jgi:hypothetical protein
MSFLVQGTGRKNAKGRVYKDFVSLAAIFTLVCDAEVHRSPVLLAAKQLLAQL